MAGLAPSLWACLLDPGPTGPVGCQSGSVASPLGASAPPRPLLLPLPRPKPLFSPPFPLISSFQDQPRVCTVYSDPMAASTTPWDFFFTDQPRVCTMYSDPMAVSTTPWDFFFRDQPRVCTQYRDPWRPPPPWTSSSQINRRYSDLRRHPLPPCASHLAAEHKRPKILPLLRGRNA